MPIRMSGLTSGLDTEAIVSALVSAQRTKTTKVENKLTKSEWTKEIWTDLNKKIYSLYTAELTKFKTQGNYKAKKVTSSNDSIASATATSSAANGSHTLEIKKLAASQSITSGEINASTTSAKLVDIGMKEGTVITITGDDNKTKEVKVTKEATLGGFLDACKSVGLNASFDSSQKRLFISSSKSGKDSGFSITTQTGAYTVADSKLDSLATAAGDNMLAKSIELIKNADAGKLKELASLAGGSPLYDSDDELIEAYDLLERAIGSSKLTSLVQDYVDEAEQENGGDSAWNALEKEAKAAASSNVFKDIAEKTTQYMSLLKNATEDQIAMLRGESIKDEDGNEYTVEVPSELYNAYEYVSEHVADVDGFKESIKQYAASKDYVAENGTDDQLSFLGLQSISKDMATGNYGGMSYVQAADSEIVLDGAALSSNSNEFSVNGLTISLKNVTAEGQSVSLNTTTDVDAVYNMVKDFVKKYNEILEELNEKHDAKTAKGYEPLTDEQKEVMTEDQIEKWETKIKDSLLRRDGTLNGIITVMRSSLFTTTKVDGVAYSLSSFGIMTSSDYTEKGKLHIFGDPDDETYSTETNKLKEAIESNPDAVMKTLSDAGQALYEALTKKMERTSLSSALTFYNDKKMDSDQTTYKKQIKEMEKKLTEMEDRYYKKFTAMEKAMTQMQSQTNALSSLTGFTG
ncbi:MAG: flagellar filament capping protein FliD [Lachnospiraceae bacterium]|nr:flagellar filament capping protein FliD [Lachnospiraceae bacterium]